MPRRRPVKHIGTFDPDLNEDDVVCIHRARRKGKGKRILDVAPLNKSLISEALMHGTRCRGISQFYLYTHAFIHERNERYFPLPFEPKLVLIYRPQMDARLSWSRRGRITNYCECGFKGYTHKFNLHASQLCWRSRYCFAGVCVCLSDERYVWHQSNFLLLSQVAA